MLFSIRLIISILKTFRLMWWCSDLDEHIQLHGYVYLVNELNLLHIFVGPHFAQ